ncbi:hypothetical protein [Spirosoma liriopis]|uniref:hypothetical protein n=1 Tax=Spirosoma liriopis TaxID=2937440 RepID=UPI0020BF96F6|nr:hypothetical protein [Spirosoma liriopis]
MPDELWLPRPEIHLAPKLLRQYIGCYVADQPGGYEMDIVLRDGQLYSLGHHKDQLPELALLASSADRFFPQK